MRRYAEGAEVLPERVLELAAREACRFNRLLDCATWLSRWSVDYPDSDLWRPTVSALRQSARGRALRHPFTGVAVALECGVPDDVCHIVAAHAGEGDLVKRTTEATIVHHADFMSYLPFKNLAS